MADSVGPAVARERLRTRLRELREERGLAADSVARDMYWSVSKLNRIETGAVTIQPVEVRALLGYYGVQDSKEVTLFMNLAKTSRSKQWWSHHKLSKEYQQFIAFEAEASRVSVYEPLIVPGLLQTSEYAHAVTAAIRGQTRDHEDVEARVEVRMIRQHDLFARMERDNPPTLLGAVDQSVLRRSVGGPEVLGGQLERLLELSEWPHIDLVVIPYESTDHRALAGGGFELLEFTGSRDPDVLFVESVANDFMTKVPLDTTTYRDTVESLRKAGLAGADAKAAIREALDRL
jgi:transcriptional regulator with XRE-family HTH domain